MPEAPLRCLAAAALALVGCTQTSIGDYGPLPPTAIVVDPAEFLGEVACLPGGMRSYVATIIDVSASTRRVVDGGLVLPSSKPTGCTVPVSFQRIARGHEFIAEIDGYDRDDIERLAPGSRIQVDSETDEYVPPRWTTSCGRLAPSEPTEAGTASTDAGSQPPNCHAQFPDDAGAWEAHGPTCSYGYRSITVNDCAPLRDNADSSDGGDGGDATAM